MARQDYVIGIDRSRRTTKVLVWDERGDAGRGVAVVLGSSETEAGGDR